ncbi:MAG: hypothetical protein VXZ40_03185 [Nanoarchaeota archaeon]|nr:hypothetical protein [Nanoarchaeota archaeon]
MSIENTLIFKSTLEDLYAINIGSQLDPFWMGYQTINRKSEFFSIGTMLPDHYLQENVGEFIPLRNNQVPKDVDYYLNSFPKLDRQTGAMYIEFGNDMVLLFYNDLYVNEPSMELKGNIIAVVLDSDIGSFNCFPHCINSPVEEILTDNIVGSNVIEHLMSEQDVIKKCNALGLSQIPKTLEEKLGFKTRYCNITT